MKAVRTGKKHVYTANGTARHKSVAYRLVDKRVSGLRDESGQAKKAAGQRSKFSAGQPRRKVDSVKSGKKAARVAVSKKPRVTAIEEEPACRAGGEDAADDSDASLSDAARGRRFSARQKARRARAHNRNSDSDDGSVRSGSPFRSVMDAAIERKLVRNDTDVRPGGSSTGAGSPVSVDEVEFSDESEVADRETVAPAVVRQRSRSLMELMCTETLDDFESPSKDGLKDCGRPLPVLMHNITRVNHGAAPAGRDGDTAPGGEKPQASSLLRLADVVIEQA